MYSDDIEPKSAGVWFLPFYQALHSDISGHGELINTASVPMDLAIIIL